MNGNYFSFNPFKFFLGKLVHFLLGGWKLVGDLPRDRKKYVMIAAHHTSNWDFVVGIAAKLILGVRIRFFAKDSLFTGPLGALMRSFGGIPIERSQSVNRVDLAVDEINNHDHFILAIAPEGTRSKVDRWRTGFYHIAVKANIPVVPIAFDFSNRRIIIGDPIDLSGRVTDDFQKMHQFFVPYQPRHPEWSCNDPAEHPEIYTDKS